MEENALHPDILPNVPATNLAIPCLSGIIPLFVPKLNGNEKISTLPPELGRLNMYDLKVDGCRLTEPLASMFKSELVKDVLGYLRSILDE